MKNNLRRFYIKLTHWEYWPMWLVYFPVMFYYLYLSIKAKSFFFFSAANPNIETGGMFFESKWDIFKTIPKQYFPNTILIEKGTALNDIKEKINIAKLSFPIIAKPDRGERGWCVKKINDFQELENYHEQYNFPYLLQAFIEYPMELSVFYYKNPKQEKGTITSVTYKKLLTITGDGNHTVAALINANDRAFLKKEIIEQNNQLNDQHILKPNEELLLVPYGNHSLGACFYDYSHIIDKKLVTVFDDLSKKIDGLYYGRYDLRCQNINDLKEGKNFLIVELNGSGAEPCHIYDPKFKYWKAQKVLAQHYKMMYEAATINHKQGVPYMSLKSFLATKKAEKLFKENAFKAV